MVLHRFIDLGTQDGYWPAFTAVTFAMMISVAIWLTLFTKRKIPIYISISIAGLVAWQFACWLLHIPAVIDLLPTYLTIICLFWWIAGIEARKPPNASEQWFRRFQKPLLSLLTAMYLLQLAPSIHILKLTPDSASYWTPRDQGIFAAKGKVNAVAAKAPGTTATRWAFASGDHNWSIDSDRVYLDTSGRWYYGREVAKMISRCVNVTPTPKVVKDPARFAIDSPGP